MNRVIPTTCALAAALCSLLVSAPASEAVSVEDRCEAYRLAAIGERVSRKLHCRAWAKLTGQDVDEACLQRAEDLFLAHLFRGGASCVVIDDLVTLGEEADDIVNAVVASVETDPPLLPDLTGTWETRTVVSLDVDSIGGFDCEAWEVYNPPPCPDPSLFAVIECTLEIVQDGDTLHHESTCMSAPGSAFPIPGLQQEATGPIDLRTGEWGLRGTVLFGDSFVEYRGEGVFAPNGQSFSGITTSSLGGPEGPRYLSFTSGSRVTSE